MKKLIIKELQLCSLKEKKAKCLPLDPKKNLIIGGNDTGKSCLMKSIYHAFGADVKFEPAWESADVKSLVTFTVDNGQTYSILRDQRTFSVFDSNMNHLKTFTSVTKGLGPYLADMFDFKLRLPTKGNSQDAMPTPAFMFLPFYIDQDKGWNRSFDSFERLQQFSDWRTPTIEFHTGIRPNEYYATKIEIKSKIIKRDEIQSEVNATDAILFKHRERYKDLPFDIDFDAFRKEVDELLVRAEIVKSEEEKFRSDLRELYDEKHVVSHQLSSVSKALQVAEKDFKFTVENPDEEIECPICHTTFDNRFADRIEIAKDVNEFDQLLNELQQRALQIEASIKDLKIKTEPLKSELFRINAILSEKRKTIELRDLIKAEGRRELIDDLKGQRDLLLGKLRDLQAEIDALSEKLKSYENKDQRNRVVSSYFLATKRYLNDLDVHNIAEEKFKKVSSVIEKSGSDKPRALLAYFFGILEAIKQHSTFMLCPIVVDSPNQQAQDKTNIKNILEVIRDKAPSDCQVILAVEGLHGVKFNWNTIELKTKLSVLGEEVYPAVSSLFKTLMEKRVAE